MPISPSLLRKFEFEGGHEVRDQRIALVRAIEKSRFSIEYVVDTDRAAKGQAFGVFIKPNRDAKARYGIDREVLVWCSTFPSFSARDTNKIREIQAKHGTRLGSMFVVLVTSYQKSDRSVLEVESGYSQTIVHVTFDDLKTTDFDQLLAESLYSRDPFDLAGAVVRAADFFGRRDQIDLAVAEIESGTSQIGFFGLRKAGKTSLLNRLFEKLQNSARVYVARLDLQWTVSINSSPEYTAWALGESIYAAHKDLRRIGGFHLFGKFATFAEISNVEAIWEWLANDIKIVASKANRPICLLVDEIERMFEGTGAGFVRFWRVIRGLDQQFPGRLRVVVGGTSPQCAEDGYIGEFDNPMFKYLRIHYLGPLKEDEFGDMLTSLGRLAGMSFDRESVEWAYESTGGHPALIRALGSAIHASQRKHREVASVDLDLIRSVKPTIQQNSGSLLDQMLASLAHQYPDEYELLEELSQGRISAFESYSVAFPVEYRRLVNYGLVSSGTPARVKIGQLQSRIQRRLSDKPKERAEASLQSGDTVEGWEICDLISRGAFSEVYRVCSPHEKDHALKVFFSSNPAVISREVDVLREFKHPNVVEYYGTLATPNGRSCILMELLMGRPLSDYCVADMTPTSGEWFDWLGIMLDALGELHPNAIEPASVEMSVEEFRDWNRSKLGYVHRDIKPENIVVVAERGPVILDFNISSKVGDDVLTTSATPGYSPGPDVTWGPAVDLYALAVTFAEVGAGVRLRDSTLSDLRTALESVTGNRALAAVDLLMDSSETSLTTREIAKKISRLGAGGRI